MYFNWIKFWNKVGQDKNILNELLDIFIKVYEKYSNKIILSFIVDKFNVYLNYAKYTIK